MDLNEVMNRLGQYLKAAQGEMMRGDYNAAVKYIDDFVNGCEKAHRENPDKDGQRALMSGYSLGASLFAKMFSINNGEAYTIQRHQYARDISDKGVKLAYSILLDDRNNGRSIGRSAFEFIGAVTSALMFGTTECTKDHMRHSDILIEKLYNGNPNDRTVAQLRDTYLSNKQMAGEYEAIYHRMKG